MESQEQQPMENTRDEQSAPQTLEAAPASASLQSSDDAGACPQAPGKQDHDKETAMEAEDDEEADAGNDDEESGSEEHEPDSDSGDDNEDSDMEDEDGQRGDPPGDRPEQLNRQPAELGSMLLENFMATWPRRGVSWTRLKSVADEVTARWAEIRRACLPGEPAGSLAEAGERRVLGRLIVERTHVRMVRSDDGEDVPRVYLPGSGVPVTPVESLAKPLRRLLRAANAPRPRDHDALGDGAEEQSPEDMLRTIESLVEVILWQLPILQRKVFQVRDRVAAMNGLFHSRPQAG